MEDNLQKAIKDLVKKGYITVNKNLNDDVIALYLLENMKNMTVKEFLDAFTPRELL